MTQLKNTYQSNSHGPISLEDYLQLISETKQINTEKEAELIRRIYESDEDAVRELVEANLWIVISIAKQYQNMGLSLRNLILEGNLGILSAAGRLVNFENFNFSTYAAGWVRQSILQAITEHFWISSLKSNSNGYGNRIEIVLQQINKNFLSEPILDKLPLEYA